MTPPAPVTAFVADRRRPVAVILLALGLLAVAVAGWSFLRSLRPGVPAASAVPGAPDGPSGTVNPFQSEYILGGLAALLAAAGTLGVGGALFSRLTLTTDAARLREARLTLLAAGGTVGLAAVLFGVGLFISWFGPLVKWVVNGDPSQAWKPLTALLIVLGGGGLAFAAAQPARAGERDEPAIRRLCHAISFALTTLLALVALVVGNILVASEVPARFDAGRYALDDETRTYLKDLSQDVTIHTLLEDDAREMVVNRFLTAVRAANPRRVKVVALSRTLNRPEINALKGKPVGADITKQPGLLVSVGDTDPQYTFLGMSDLFLASPDRRQSLFAGEAKFVNEVQFLFEKKVRPVVYFTQGAGELSPLPPKPGEAPGLPATGLARALERGYAVVKTVTLDAQNAAIPDDATVVVVANPRRALSAEALTALTKYRERKKSRLLVLAGPYPDAGGEVTRIPQLDTLLAPYGITLGDRFLYSETVDEVRSADILSVEGVPAQVDARNPIAQAAGDLLVPLATRELTLAPTAARTVPVLATSNRRVTWSSMENVAGNRFVLGAADVAWENITRALGNKAVAPRILRDLDIGRKERTVAALASDEDGTPRAVVFGYGLVFADPLLAEAGTRQAHLDTAVAAVNWLRERPPGSSAAAKNLGIYKPARELSPSLALYLPVGGLLLVVAFLGLGVWSYRRR